MLYVLSAGYAHPDIVIDNQFLAQLGLGLSAHEISQSYGIEKRFSSLPLDYIKTTRNQDQQRAFEVATQTPTDLAIKAVEMAMAGAGIRVEQIGLIVGDCSTPRETTPSEAQRVGKRLDYKSNAYDINIGLASFAAQIETLLNTQPERLPEYILCVSTSTMTQWADYSQPHAACVWGDGAAAIVLSTRHARGIKVLRAFCETSSQGVEQVLVPVDGNLTYDHASLVRDFVTLSQQAFGRICEGVQFNWARDRFIAQQVSAALLNELEQKLEIPSASQWRSIEEWGYTGAASNLITLALNWHKIAAGDKIALTFGCTQSRGAVLLEACL